RGRHTEPRPGVDAWSLRETYAGWYAPLAGTVGDGLNERGALGWVERYDRHVALRTSGTAATWVDQLDLLGWTLDHLVRPTGSDLRVLWSRTWAQDDARVARQDPDLRARRARLEAALGRKHPAALGYW